MEKKLNHKQKVKLAEKFLSEDERKRKINKFDSDKWLARKMAIRERDKRQESKDTAIGQLNC